MIKKVLSLLLLVVFCGISHIVHAQEHKMVVKTNFLYWMTSTPNVGVEVSVSEKQSIQLFYGLNPWKFSGEGKLRHWSVQPEYRHWFCQAFNGWFIGAHLMGGEFNMGEVDLPLGIFPELKDHRYEGWFAGGGITAGYQWMLSKHWNVEASVGLGYDYIKYDKFGCGYCGEKEKSSHRHYVGPTKAALSLIYMF